MQLGGRLGNWMFRIAAGLAHCKRHDLVFQISYSKLKKACLFDKLDFKAFGVQVGDADIVTKGQFVQDTDPFAAKIDAAYTQHLIDGNFINEENFAEYEPEVRKLYAGLTAEEKIPGSVGIHWRLGDYLSNVEIYNRWHMSSAFVMKALEHCKNRGDLFIYTDDRDKLEDQIEKLLPRLNKMFSKVHICTGDEWDTLPTLKHMTSCEELVLSASTFSWWGAYLGKPKTVVYADTERRIKYGMERFVNKRMPVGKSWIGVQDPYAGAAIVSESCIRPAVVGLFTNRYTTFFPGWWESIQTLLFPSKKKVCYVYTDDADLKYCDQDDPNFLRKLPMPKEQFTPNIFRMKWDCILDGIERAETDGCNFVVFVQSNVRLLKPLGTGLLNLACNAQSGKLAFIVQHAANEAAIQCGFMGGFIPEFKKFASAWQDKLYNADFWTTASIMRLYDEYKLKEFIAENYADTMSIWRGSYLGQFYLMDKWNGMLVPMNQWIRK